MSKQVWKFPFGLGDWPVLHMPEGATILSFADQPGVGPCLWALVDPEAAPIERKFRIAGTGHNLGDELEFGRFIGTAQAMQGQLVWHLWELTP